MPPKCLHGLNNISYVSIYMSLLACCSSDLGKKEPAMEYGLGTPRIRRHTGIASGDSTDIERSKQGGVQRSRLYCRDVVLKNWKVRAVGPDCCPSLSFRVCGGRREREATNNGD